MKYHIGNSMKAAMDYRGISVTGMAEDYGVYRQQVQRWRRQEDMHLSKIIELCKYFELTFDDFIDMGNDYE